MHILAATHWFKTILHYMDIGPWGYVVLFGLLLMCGVGLPLPEDVPLIVAGLLIGSKHMHHWWLAGILAWCGIIGGDCILYSLGKHYGNRITRVPILGRHITLKRLERAEQLFADYGVGFVAIGRLFAGIRGAMVVAAGAVRYNFVKFIIADGFAAIVSGGMFMCLGFWFGKNPDLMEKRVAEFKYTLIGVGIVLGIVLIFYIRWRTKQHKTIAQVVMEKATDLKPRSTALPTSEK